MNAWAVVVAAGRGQRFGSALPKQYQPLFGRTVLEHSLAPFLRHNSIGGVVLVLAKDDFRGRAVAKSKSKPIRVVEGGMERAHSVCAGLKAVIEQAGSDAWALVHDAARPCLSDALLQRLLDELAVDAIGGLLALPARDTLKRAFHGRVAETLDRSTIWQAQTPQMFRAGALLAAYEAALSAAELPTDEAAAMERAGQAPRLIEGSSDNLKITSPADLRLAEQILSERKA